MALLHAGPNPFEAIIPNAHAGMPAGINYEYFFDKEKIKGTLDDMKRKALYRAGSVVFQIARRSIERKGMAAPKLEVMKQHPDSSLRDLITMSMVQGNRKQASKLRERLRQIKSRDPSPPDHQPFTHKGNLRDKPGIVYAYDSTTESVVVGQGKPDMAWIASLHEFGGKEQQRAWIFIPQYPGQYTGIIGWFRTDVTPKRMDRWQQTKWERQADYDKRPYMRPAFRKAIDSGRIAAEFKNRFRVAGA